MKTGEMIKKSEKGFTLIELMIVIAIIALLAAVALPKFAGATDDAKIANVQSNLSSIRTALSVYYAKQGGYPTIAANATATATAFGTGGAVPTNLQLYYDKTILPPTPSGVRTTQFAASSDIRAAATSATDTSTGGYVYVAATGVIRADLGDGSPTLWGSSIDWSLE